MAKRIYVGVGGIARKVKKAYIGVEGLARKVKKAYIGVGGVARPVFSGGELVYYGSSEDGAVEALSVPRSGLSSVKVGNRALFAGGSAQRTTTAGYNQTTAVDSYDDSLIRSVIDPLSYCRGGMGAGFNAKFGIFVGGYRSNISSSSYVGIVDFYDTSLTHSSQNSSGTATGEKFAKIDLLSLTLGSVCLFTAGRKTSTGLHSSEAFGWDESKTYRFFSNQLATYGSNALPSAAVIEDIGIINSSGGQITCFDSSFTVSHLNGTTTGSNKGCIGFTLGNYAIFAGGGESTWTTSGVKPKPKGDVSAFDKSLTEIYLPNLIRPFLYSCATVIGQYALVGYGSVINEGSLTEQGYTNAIEVINTSLTKVAGFEKGAARKSVSASSAGNYAILSGGSGSSGFEDEVTVFSI